MRREERFMNILGGLDEKYVAMAMPSSCGHSIVGDSGNVIEIKPVDENIEISKKDLRIYWITRALGMAAALALVVGGGDSTVLPEYAPVALIGDDKVEMRGREQGDTVLGLCVVYCIKNSRIGGENYTGIAVVLVAA